jgi:acyl carrier protein
MSNDEQKRIELIFQSVLGDTANSHGSEKNQIDSIAYVELLIAFQNEFKIKFTTQDFISLRSLENIRKSVEVKIKASKNES